MTKVTFFVRLVDAGQGRQNVMVVDGIIRSQWLEGHGGSVYTGDGNPELVGEDTRALRGKGFQRKPGPMFYSTQSGWYCVNGEEFYFNSLEEENAN